MQTKYLGDWAKQAARLHVPPNGRGSSYHRTRVVTNKSGRLSDDTLQSLTRLIAKGLV